MDTKEWSDLRKRQVGHQFKDLHWTNIISKGIQSVHPYCSIAFKRHTVKNKMSKRKGPLFSCLGYCTFSDCPVCVEVTLRDESTLKAWVTFQGEEVCHSMEELKRRYVRADNKDFFGKQLESVLPRALHLQCMDKIQPKVFESGCRDQAPTAAVLKNIAYMTRKKCRRHDNEILSLLKMVEEKTDEDNEVLQKVILHPKGVMLWSKNTIGLFHQRCRDDIVYIDATGSIVQKARGKSAPFYVYELVVRHPIKGSSPIPVATYVTCQHTTASVLFFMESFQTDYYKLFGRKSVRRPVMIICDGSLVLMQAVAYSFCKHSLESLLSVYYDIVTGQLKEVMNMPILHRCLSHIMKNAKVFCKKQ